MPPTRNAPGTRSAADVERVLRLVDEGRFPRATLPIALRTATLLIYARGPADTGVFAFPNHDGRVMVPACTSVERVPAQWPGHREISGRELAGQLSGFPLVINPAGPVTAVVPAADLHP